MTDAPKFQPIKLEVDEVVAAVETGDKADYIV